MKSIHLNEEKYLFAACEYGGVRIKAGKSYFIASNVVKIQLGPTKQLLFKSENGKVLVSTFSTASQSSFYPIESGMIFQEGWKNGFVNEFPSNLMICVGSSTRIFIGPTDRLIIQHKKDTVFSFRGCFEYKGRKMKMLKTSPFIYEEGESVKTLKEKIAIGMAIISNAVFQ